jgi:hypothetical protein
MSVLKAWTVPIQKVIKRQAAKTRSLSRLLTISLELI